MEQHIAALQGLVRTATLPSLGPEVRADRIPHSSLDPALEEHLTPLSEKRRPLVRSLIYVWHDHLDAAHELAQEIESPDGSYIHGIIHRREPDYSNARYWFNRVGLHPAFHPLKNQALTYLEQQGESVLASRLAPGGIWDPYAFVDACAAAYKVKDADPKQLVCNVQAMEIRILLDSVLGL